jgi:hypothetical protein
MAASVPTADEHPEIASWRKQMRTTGKSFVVLAVAISVVAVSSQVNAQSGGRNAAIQRCMAKAHAQYPRTDRASGGSGRERTAVYTACMYAAGYRP